MEPPMAQQHIYLGAQADGKDGDTNRQAWAKTEANFNELYNGALSTTPFKNLLINGRFDIWQRGTSGFAANSGVFTADRWKTISQGSSASVSRQSFTLGQTAMPGNPRYFLRSTVSSTAGANNFSAIVQPIEGADALGGRTVTVSFWAKADSSRRIGVSIDQNPGTGSGAGALVAGAGQSVLLSSGWQQFVLTFNVPSVSGMSLGSNANDSTAINFWLDAGGTYNARSGGIVQQSGVFDIAQVQVEFGQFATNFDIRPQGVELALCQRYARIVNGAGLTGITLGATSILFAGQWPTMRGTPVTTLLKTNFSATTFELLVGSSWVAGTNCALSNAGITAQGITSAMVGFSGLTAGLPVLINNVGASILLLEAEL